MKMRKSQISIGKNPIVKPSAPAADIVIGATARVVAATDADIVAVDGAHAVIADLTAAEAETAADTEPKQAGFLLTSPSVPTVVFHLH